jgi:hypothetical protein
MYLHGVVLSSLSTGTALKARSNLIFAFIILISSNSLHFSIHNAFRARITYHRLAGWLVNSKYENMLLLLNLRWLPWNSWKILRNITKNMKIVYVPGEIRNWHLRNRRPNLYHLCLVDLSSQTYANASVSKNTPCGTEGFQCNPATMQCRLERMWTGRISKCFVILIGQNDSTNAPRDL